jgi:hypothetical protein
MERTMFQLFLLCVLLLVLSVIVNGGCAGLKKTVLPVHFFPFILFPFRNLKSRQGVWHWSH